MNETISIGFAITGSFCTFAKTLTLLSELVKQGYEVQPIFSNHTSHLDNRFTAAETFCKKSRTYYRKYRNIYNSRRRANR